MLLFIVHPSKFMSYIRCDVGEGSTGTVLEQRHRPLLFVSSHDASTRELRPPRLAWAQARAVSDDQDPNDSKPLACSTSEVEAILRRSSQFSTLTWRSTPYISNLLWFTRYYTRVFRITAGANDG